MKNVFIIHVSKGYEERRRHIDSHLPKFGITKFEYILKGDIGDIEPNFLSKFNNQCMPSISCFYKHYLALKAAVSRGGLSLVLEDDAILTKNAKRKLEKIINDAKGESNFLINIEQSNHSVPLSIREKGKNIYLSNRNKRTGGYIIDSVCAERIVNYIESSSVINMPVDTFYTEVRNLIGFNIFWVEPPIVKQGSKNGTFSSELSNRTQSKLYRIPSFFRDWYQKLVVTNFSSKRKQTFLNVVKY